MGLMTGLNIFKAIVVFVNTLLIARFVPPSDFGLVSFAIPLMAFLTLITDLGLAGAIVRHENLSEREAGAVVVFLGLAGAVSGGLLWGASSALEHAMGMPGLKGVLAGFAIVTAASIWSVGPRAVLERDLKYENITWIEAVAIILAIFSFGLGIYFEYGVIAFVSFHVVLQVSRAFLFHVAVRHTVVLNFAIKAIRPLIAVGVWVLAANILAFLARNIDRLIVAKVLGASALGIYGLAYQFMIVPLMLFSWPVSAVLTAALSRNSRQPDAQIGIMKSVTIITAAVVFPLMMLFGFSLEFPMAKIYGERWAGLAMVIALLAPAGAIQSLAVYCGSYFVSKGLVGINLSMAAFNAGILIFSFVLAVEYGLMVTAACYTIGSLVVCLVMIFVMCKSAKINIFEYFEWLKCGMLASLAGVIILPLTWALPSGIILWLSVVVVFFVWVAFIYWVCRSTLLNAVKFLLAHKAGA